VQVRARADGDALRIEVQDHGIGIAPADLSRLFVDFQQLDAGASKQHAGTGLGLALTKRLVEAQGGSVGVTSTLGQGSTFHAVLPRRSLGREQMPAPRSFAASDADAPTVLIAEGNAGHQAIIARGLIAAGYAVETVATGAQAIERCRARRFDAIAVGVALPDLAGLELARRLHHEHRGDVTLLVTVADDSASGFVIDDILPRAIDAATMLASLQEVGAGSGPVLIVDDDPGSRRLMQETLAQVGYDAILEADASRALAIVEQTAPAAIVLDLMMPGMDGFEFLARLRARPASATLPVLVWTAKDLSRAELERLRERAQGVVGKNSAIAELVAALRSVVPRPGGDALT
jgi:DNA-binding response OmpR family regulator